jgi:transcriptional regulator GlxA family with amidase domain
VTLRERLLGCPSAAARFDLAERLLRARLRDRRLGHPAVWAAVRQMRRARGNCRVRRLVDDLGLSQRRFIQLFQAQVGVTPKMYCRLERFQHVLRVAHRATDGLDWAELAADGGYCDQSHLIHEFAEFAGMRPTDYLKRRGHHPNHVAVT